jgi:hypothetical protein
MPTRLFFAALPSILSLTFGLQIAHADIYTWTDADGRVNVSNLAPPAGARVTSVMHETAPKIAPPSDSYREAARQAEALALADRVRQLESEVELARRPPPPPPEWAMAPAPPPVQYAYPPAPPAQYDVTPQASSECDPARTNCGPFGVLYPYPYQSVVVIRAPYFRRSRPDFDRGGRHVAWQRPPMHVAGGLHPLILR